MGSVLVLAHLPGSCDTDCSWRRDSTELWRKVCSEEGGTANSAGPVHFPLTDPEGQDLTRSYYSPAQEKPLKPHPH